MLANIFYVLGIIVLVLYLGPILDKSSRDSTDAVKKRSGLIVYTDAATGVQYLSTVAGGLTVRVGQDGRPFQKE